MEENNNKIKVKLTTIIVLILVVTISIIGIVFTILNKNNYKKIDEGHDIDIGLPEFNAGDYENLFKDNNLKSDYNSNEEYTDLSYYYLTVMDSSYSTWYSGLSGYDYNNILKEVTYVRYVYQENNWVLAENKGNSPFFSQTGNGIIVNYECYYIPIYELEEGKNKVVVTEITNGGTKKEKEFIINRTPSEYDNMYQTKVINKSDTLSLNTYQDIININMNDYNKILLTGSFYSNYDIKDITWTRYEHENNNEEWKIIPKSQTNNVYYQSEGKAKIIGNYWAIDILNIDSDGTKIEITATDSAGAKVTKTVLINNISQSMNYDFENSNFDDGDITNDKGMRFINNEVLIMFNDNVKESRCQEIINEINGKIISSMGIIKEYEVQVNYKFTSYSSIEQYCKILEERYEEITNVSANMLFEMDLN